MEIRAYHMNIRGNISSISQVQGPTNKLHTLIIIIIIIIIIINILIINYLW